MSGHLTLPIQLIIIEGWCKLQRPFPVLGWYVAILLAKKCDKTFAIEVNDFGISPCFGMLACWIYAHLLLKIARLLRYSHISSYIKEHFQSLLALNTKFSLFSQMEVAPKYLRDVIRPLPHILRSLERRELFVSRTMTKSRSFSAAGPSAISFLNLVSFLRVLAYTRIEDVVEPLNFTQFQL